MIAAMNPCPCGYSGDTQNPVGVQLLLLPITKNGCLAPFSTALMPAEVSSVDNEKLSGDRLGETSQ